MSSPNERSERNRQIFDDLYWEMSVLEACCWGAYYVTREQYCTRIECMEIALLHEFGRFKKMLESLNLDSDKDASKGKDKNKGKDTEGGK
ncbi:MAG: hypothetical protein ACE5IR_25230 [bacterium]